tara:strand:+ start:121342 stop:121497 length:156 start_codon:yes stop_codon:yes gene_type:complete
MGYHVVAPSNGRDDKRSLWQNQPDGWPLSDVNVVHDIAVTVDDLADLSTAG